MRVGLCADGGGEGPSVPVALPAAPVPEAYGADVVPALGPPAVG